MAGSVTPICLPTADRRPPTAGDGDGDGYGSGDGSGDGSGYGYPGMTS